jgi:pimeloyl-ACP methyl ester carboxylesterase
MSNAARLSSRPGDDNAKQSRITSVVCLLFAVGWASCALADQPLVIQKQGSFMAGGTVVSTPGTFNPMSPTPAGQTLSGDHSYVQFQIPAGANRQNSALMWGSFVGNSWETTPDGREGFEQIFLRRNWNVYVADRPRMGRSARTTVGTTITPTAGDQGSFIQFRLGLTPDTLYPNSKFPPGPEALDQFRRWGVQSVGPGDATLTLNDLLAIVNKIGPTVLFTHSASSLSGYQAAMQNPNIRGIVAFESTGVPCPSDNPFPPVVGNFGMTTCTQVPPADFKKLAQVPILMQFGDNIPSAPSTYFGLDFWYRMHAIDLEFMNAVNALGGNVTLLDLPSQGIIGNTHFAFTDLNNVQVADLISDWLHENGLDQMGAKH